MRKSNKAKQTPSRTCADCYHFCACHQWVTSISTDVAPQCPAFEPVRYRTLAELDDLRQMHKGDLAPVVHARWETVKNSTYCSACNAFLPAIAYTFYDHDDEWECCEEIDKTRYCPHCGAKMDGGADNE